jgi:hypothetical protein
MAGGVINTGSHPKALWPGVYGWWGQVYSEHEEEMPDLYDVVDSQQAYEEEVQATGFGLAPVKTEGGPLSYDYEIQGPVQRYIHLAYGLGFKVTMEEIQDDLYPEVAANRAEANAFSIRQTVENLGAAPYNDAFTGNVFQYATGQSLCSTTQPNTTGGTFANALSPGADMTEASLEDMCILAMGLQSDRGLLVSIMPVSLHIARQQWFNANRILKSVLQSGNGNNDPNVLRMTNAFPKGIKLNHYFTSPNAWFVRTNVRKGLKWFWRIKPTFDQDNDYDTKNAKAATIFRASCGATDPRCILGSNGP